MRVSTSNEPCCDGDAAGEARALLSSSFWMHCSITSLVTSFVTKEVLVMHYEVRNRLVTKQRACEALCNTIILSQVASRDFPLFCYIEVS